MENDYRIVLHTKPAYHDNPKAPYFWCIFKCDEKTNELANFGSGWSFTPQSAYKDAESYLFYLKIRDTEKALDKSDKT